MAEIYTASSLEKVLLHKKPRVEKSGSMAKNEVFAFQVVYKYRRFANDIKIEIESPIKEFISYILLYKRAKIIFNPVDVSATVGTNQTSKSL